MWKESTPPPRHPKVTSHHFAQQTHSAEKSARKPQFKLGTRLVWDFAPFHPYDSEDYIPHPTVLARGGGKKIVNLLQSPPHDVVIHERVRPNTEIWNAC